MYTLKWKLTRHLVSGTFRDKVGFCTRERWSHKGVNDSSVKHAPALEMKARSTSSHLQS